MKKYFLLLAFSLFPVLLHAQFVERLYLDMRGAFHQETTQGEYSSQMVGEYLNFHTPFKLFTKLLRLLRHSLTFL